MWTFKKIIIKMGILVFSIYYFLLKLIPIKKNKILCLSRQSDKLSLDFELLIKQLKIDKPNIEIVIICNRFEENKSSKLKFSYNILRSLYHLATSNVCVLDAYWPTVSIFKHKKDITIIQMWHSIGKIKKSGHQTLDKASGKSKKMAELLNMHKNYDYVIAGGKAFNEFYCASFDIEKDVIINSGLPRIDYLIDNEKTLKEQIYAVYPKLQKKKNILYVPTFRKNSKYTPNELLEAKELKNYNFIMKCHPLQEINSNNKDILTCSEFTSVDLLSIADYVITDYSAIALEAAILKKKTLYYLYDYEEYTTNNGLNLDPKIVMKNCSFNDASSLLKIIINDNYDQQSLDNYIQKYLPSNLGNSTAELSKLIIKNILKGD